MADAARLNCMEIWGGSEPAQRFVAVGGLDAWVEARPHGDAAAGGDVHYLSSCAAGQVTRLFLADVSGHGAGVADVARVLRGLMRKHVNHHDQLGFVRGMNAAFVEQSAANIFATAVVCTFNAPRGELSLCNAGHPPPLIYRAATTRWSLLEADDAPGRPADAGASDSTGASANANGSNIPLGIHDMAGYEQLRVTLGTGDRVFCYTDSLIEARDAATGDPLGPPGLLALANALPPATPPDAFIPALVDALHARVGTTLEDDDVTMLLFTPNPARRRPGFVARTIAPLRVIARMIRGT